MTDIATLYQCIQSLVASVSALNESTSRLNEYTTKIAIDVAASINAVKAIDDRVTKLENRDAELKEIVVAESFTDKFNAPKWVWFRNRRYPRPSKPEFIFLSEAKARLDSIDVSTSIESTGTEPPIVTIRFTGNPFGPHAPEGVSTIAEIKRETCDGCACITRESLCVVDRELRAMDSPYSVDFS